MSYWLVGAAAVSAVGTLYAGDQQSKAAQAQAGAARQQGAAAQTEASMDEAFRKQEAEDITRSANDEANKIKRQAAVVRASMISQQAASGVVIGEGSASAAAAQIDALSSADVLVALYSGIDKSTATRAGARFGAEAGRNKNRAAGQAASSYEAAGNAALIGSYLQAGSAVAGGIARAGGLSSKSPGLTVDYSGMATNTTGVRVPTAGGA